MKKGFLITFVLTVLIFSTIESVSACWCRTDPEETNTEANLRKTIARMTDSSDFVFAGKFIEANDSQMVFEITESWKGDLKGKVFFPNLYGLNDKGKKEYFIDSCQFFFELDKNYLVYGNADITGFSVSKCGRTNLLEKAERDITELNRDKSPLSHFISKSFFNELK